MPRKNFAFRFAWFEAIAHLSWDLRLEVIEATIRYAETGSAGELSSGAEEAFEKFILPDFRRRAKAAEYRARRKARMAAEAAAESARQVRTLATDVHSNFPITPIDCSMAQHRAEVRWPRRKGPPANRRNKMKIFDISL